MVFLACLLVAGYFAYTAAAGAYHSHQLRQDEAAAHATVERLHQQKAYLEAIRAYVSTDAYVEQEARRQLGYIRQGETPFVVLSPPLPEEPRKSGQWWERLFPR